MNFFGEKPEKRKKDLVFEDEYLICKGKPYAYKWGDDEIAFVNARGPYAGEQTDLNWPDILFAIFDKEIDVKVVPEYELILRKVKRRKRKK